LPSLPVPTVPVVEHLPVDHVAPATGPTVTVSAGDQDVALVPLSVAGAALAGVVLGLDVRRRRRQARLARGRQIELPTGALAADERVLRGSARLGRAERVAAAVRQLGVELAGRPAPVRARYLLVDDTGVTVALTDPADPPPGWSACVDPVGWRCELDDDALVSAPVGWPGWQANPWPALLPLGVTRDDRDVFVDVEGLGVLSITGDQEASREVLGAAIVSLGASPYTELVTVLDDGAANAAALGGLLDNRVAVNDVGEVAERMTQWIEPFDFDGDHLLAQRMEGGGEFEPCVAAIGEVASDDDRERLLQLPCDGRHQIAIVTTDAKMGGAMLNVNADGDGTFDGVELRCNRLTDPVVTAVRALVDQADDAPPVDIAATALVTDTAPTVAEPVVDEGALFTLSEPVWHVRLLGPLRVVDDAGVEMPAGLHRQLMALLAVSPWDLTSSTSPIGLTSEEVIAQVWADKGDYPGLVPRLSELRKMLGHGETLVGRHFFPVGSRGGRHRLSHVQVDALQFRSLLHEARRTEGQDQMALLTASLELVDGEIGAGAMSHFAWSTRIIHDLEVAVLEAGLQLGEAAIDAGQYPLARWAASQVRLAVPHDQRPVRVAVQACAAMGDMIGVRRLRDELLDSLDSEMDPDVDAAFKSALG
jgi:hypothetical protein